MFVVMVARRYGLVCCPALDHHDEANVVLKTFPPPVAVVLSYQLSLAYFGLEGSALSSTSIQLCLPSKFPWLCPLRLWSIPPLIPSVGRVLLVPYLLSRVLIYGSRTFASMRLLWCVSILVIVISSSNKLTKV
jgi:hypothetical protein